MKTLRKRPTAAGMATMMCFFAAGEELARLQSGIATLRADLINRRAVLVHRFRSVAAHQGAYMLPEMAVIEDVLRALCALVPEEEEEQ